MANENNNSPQAPLREEAEKGGRWVTIDTSMYIPTWLRDLTGYKIYYEEHEFVENWVVDDIEIDDERKEITLTYAREEGLRWANYSALKALARRGLLKVGRVYWRPFHHGRYEDVPTKARVFVPF